MGFDFGYDRIGTADNSKPVYIQTIMGKSVAENVIPFKTADASNNPYVVLGSFANGERIGITKDNLSLGMLVAGAPGTGKTNFINLNLDKLIMTMGNDDVIVVFDTKGDYLKEFGGRIPQNDRIIIGSGEEYDNLTSYHNIFGEIMKCNECGQYVYSSECDTDALDISSQLFSSMQSETQPIFPAMAEQILAAVLIYFMRTFTNSDQSKLNNKELIRFFATSTNEDICKILNLSYMTDQRSCSDYIAAKSNQTQGVNSYIGTILRRMFIGPFAKNDKNKEFSMRKIIEGREKKVIFIEYDLRQGNVLSPMYGVLIDRALSYALGGRNGRRNIYFILDEMLLLPKLNHLCDSMNFGRARGVKLICGLQNVSGLEDLYGEAGARNLLASFQNIVCFRLTDFYTRQFITNRFGNNYQNLSISPEMKNLNVQREGHTVEDYTLLSLKMGEAVISLSGSEPFLFTVPAYRL